MLTVSSGFKSANKALAVYSDAKFDLIEKTNEYLLNNIVLNGNFDNSTTSWTTAASSISVTSGILSVLATGQYGRANQTITAISGNKYYVASYSKADSSSVRLQVLNATGATNLGFKAHTGGNTYELLSTIATAIDTSIILNVGRDTRTSAWTTSYHDYVFVFDLTTIFGAGNEPLIADIDLFVNNFGNYFLSANYITGTKISFDSDDIIKMDYYGSSIQNDKVLGNLAQHSLTIELQGDITSTIDLAKENVIESYVGVRVSGVYQYVKQQTFTITEISYSDTTNITKIIASDYLLKLNKEFVDTNTYPMTLKAYYESVLTYCGLTLENTTFLNDTFSVASKPFADYTSCKEISARVAEMALCFVVINKVNSKVELRSAFEALTSADETLTKDNYFSLKLNDHNFGTLGINTLVLKISQIDGENDSKENATNVAIDGAIEIVIEDNPFINTHALRLSVIDAMFAIVDTKMFQPYSIEYRGFPYLELGDIITVTKMDTSTVNLPIYEWTLKYNGGLQGSLSAKALNKAQTSNKYLSTNENKVRGIEVVVDKVNGDFTILAGMYYNGELESTGRYVFDGTGAYFYSDAFKLYDNATPTPNLKVYFDTVNSRYVFNGEIDADSGVIGGFTIGATKLTAGATNATAVGVASGETYAFWAGHLTASSAPFRVTRAGVATIASATIGGWNVNSTSIYKGGVKLDSANERIYLNSGAYLSAGTGTTNIDTSGSFNITGAVTIGTNITMNADTAGNVFIKFGGITYYVYRDTGNFLKVATV